MGGADFRGSRVMVCGLARSGYAAAKLLIKGGAAVRVTDAAEPGGLPQDKRRMAAELASMGAEISFGTNPGDEMAEFHYLVISPGIPIDTEFILKARGLGVPVIGEMELGSRVCRADIIAVTGTNGKTTATTIAGDIMKRHRPGSETLGNIGRAFCERAEDIPHGAWATLEVSSFQLESATTFHPRIAAVLNITEDHMNRHYTMDNYIAVKERVFTNQDRNDLLILNYDDPACRNMAVKTASRVAYFSAAGACVEGAPCVYARDGGVYYGHMGYTARLWDIADMALPFRHILEDAMAAALIAMEGAGAPAGIVADTVLAFRGVPHRMEYAGRAGGVDFYNDSKATNVDSAVKALESVDGKVILIGGGQEKNADFTPWARLFAQKVESLILLGETAERIAASCREAGFTDWVMADGLYEAVRMAKERAKPGGRVLLSPACASLDMFKDYEERGALFKRYALEERV